MVENVEDTNAVMAKAISLRKNGHFQRALEHYLFLADGDGSLDGGWLGVQIAECYESLGRLNEARYWAGRAESENPTLVDRREVRERLGPVTLDGEDFFSTTWDSGATLADLDETRRVLGRVPGGAALLQWFDGKVSFHDSEILRLDLNRSGGSQLELAIVYPRPRLGVTFYLTDWIDTAISGFSHQNVIGDLVIREVDARPLEDWELGVGARPGAFEIDLKPIFGAYGTIRATIARIEFKELDSK